MWQAGVRSVRESVVEAGDITTGPDTPRLDVRLLGGCRITHDGAPVAFGSRLHSLLAYLVLHRDVPQGRQHVAFTLWPDSTEAQARTNQIGRAHV